MSPFSAGPQRAPPGTRWISPLLPWEGRRFAMCKLWALAPGSTAVAHQTRAPRTRARGRPRSHDRGPLGEQPMSLADLSEPPSLTTLCYPTAAKNTPKSPLASCPIRLARSGTQLLVLWVMASCGESTTLKASLHLRMTSASRLVNK